MQYLPFLWLLKTVVWLLAPWFPLNTYTACMFLRGCSCYLWTLQFVCSLIYWYFILSHFYTVTHIDLLFPINVFQFQLRFASVECADKKTYKSNGGIMMNYSLLTTASNILISIKCVVHPKLKIISFFTPSSCYKPAFIYFFCWTQKKIFWRIRVTEHLLVPIDFHRRKILWKSMGTINCLVTHTVLFFVVFFCIHLVHLGSDRK